ncbi:MAG TPA: DUF4386 domain-containing protein [Candidatus Elarobacter sp.]|nr:DUF4386 domain-containing protein [Candidatus Elarobacter sp.]
MDRSIRRYARFGGVLYLCVFIAATFGEVFVTGALVADGNAPRTAAKIAGDAQLWRLSVGAECVTLLCDVAIAWVLYVILRPAGQRLALLAAFFRLTYVAVYAGAVVANVMALRLAQARLADAAMFALRAHDAAFALGLVFFGGHLAIVGFLLAQRPIAQQWLAVILVITGACYIVNTFSGFVLPSLHAVLFPWILVPAFFGELGLTFWLLFDGPRVAAMWDETQSAP